MEKQQVFYIHGGEAFSDYDKFLEYLRTKELKTLEEKPKRWADLLQEDLGNEFEVFKPQMPNKQNAKYEEWKIWFERHFDFLHEGVILVGWSQGAYFLLKYLIENITPFKVSSLLLLAAPCENDNFGGEDGGDFRFDIDRLPIIAERVGYIHIFHSKDDFVVPYEHALKYKEALPKATLHTFEDRNHFLQEEFPELIEEIQKT